MSYKGTHFKHKEETKKKISETKKKQGIIPKTAFKKGYIPWNKGKKCLWVSERNKIMNKERRGKNHWNWKGGISRVYKTGYYSEEYKEWREKVFERDNYICQMCGSKDYITAHHIKSFAYYPELRFDVDNGITLCEKCHSTTDNYKGRAKKTYNK